MLTFVVHLSELVSTADDLTVNGNPARATTVASLSPA
jgi:hypothetical protein